MRALSRRTDQASPNLPPGGISAPGLGHLQIRPASIQGTQSYPHFLDLQLKTIAFLVLSPPLQQSRLDQPGRIPYRPPPRLLQEMSTGTLALAHEGDHS